MRSVAIEAPEQMLAGDQPTGRSRLIDALRLALSSTLLRPVPAGALQPAELFGAEPLAIYLHVPFCGSLCAYCSFNKLRDGGQLEDYAGAVEREIDYYARQPRLQGMEVSSIYIGGGTPSYPPAELIERLLAGVARSFRTRAGVQVTLEANPESVVPDKLRRYRAAGVNRISLGVQTFDEQRLRALGRRHRRQDIDRALQHIRAAGFEELSIDLMYGLPGQSSADFAADLELAVAAPITHLSLFPLDYRPGTPLHRRRAAGRPLWRMYSHALARLAAAGFEQYTTEDFTRSGCRCAYQVDVWQPPGSACLGLGPGALSTLGGFNWHNAGRLDDYIAAAQVDHPPMAAGGRRTARQEMFEHVLLATKCLRLEPGGFAQRFGMPPRAVLGPLPVVLRVAGLARRTEDGALELTARGRFVASRLWSRYILDKLAAAAR